MKAFSPLTETMTLLLLLGVVNSWAQNLRTDQVVIENSIQVNSTINQAWLVLSDFAGVGNFHVLYDESSAINESSPFAVLGAERESLMPNGIYNNILKERVIDLVEGSHYTFEVFDSENISLESMEVTYGVRTDAEGLPEIYSRMTYDMGSGVKTSFSKRRFNRDNKISLLSYKYYIETGKVEKDLKSLKKWFNSNETRSDGGELIATRNSLPE